MYTFHYIIIYNYIYIVNFMRLICISNIRPTESVTSGGIAEMALFNPEVRRRTDALDAAGNTTAAIGKGFAIGSAALVSLALCLGKMWEVFNGF